MVATIVLRISGGDPHPDPHSKRPTTLAPREKRAGSAQEDLEGPEMEAVGQLSCQDQQNPSPSAITGQSATPSTSDSRLDLTTTLGDLLAATFNPALTIPLRDTEEFILVDRPPVDVRSSRPGLSSTSTGRNRPREIQTKPMVNSVIGRGETERGSGIIYTQRNR